MAGLEVVVAAAFCDFPVIVAIILALYNGRSPIDIEETNIAKPYYLSYKSWNAGNRDYYPAVKSTGTAYNDYAGYPGKPIQLLHIDAYRNDGVQLRTGVVVMYRVHVDNRWLPWVSNAEPEWMRKVHAQYNLDGTLDTESYYAGNKGQNINGVEIRIFEENGTDITPTGKSKIIKTPHLNQHDEGYPTGCESVTTVMALRYAGIPISIDYFVDYLPKKLSGPPFDPDVEFGGHPASASGYGCYAPVSKVTCDNCLYGEKKHAEVLRGKSIGSLCSDYIDNNIPVIFWATDSMKPSYQRDPWTVNGKTIRWISPMHCLLLVGYDDYHYIFNDPLKRTEVTYYRKELVETAYKALNQQAVVIVDNPIPVYKFGAVENRVTKELYPIMVYENGKSYSESSYQREVNAAEEKPTNLRKLSFNTAKFFSGLKLDGTFNDARKHPLSGGIAGNLVSAVAAVGANLDTLYIDIDYYIEKATKNRKAVIRCGEKSRVNVLKSWKFHDVPVSYKSTVTWNPNCDTITMETWYDKINKLAKSEYGRYKGITPSNDYSYDLYATISSKRKEDNYLTQILLGEDGKMYEYSKLYDNEKFEIVVTTKGIFPKEIDRLNITPFLNPLSQLTEDKVALFDVRIVK